MNGPTPLAPGEAIELRVSVSTRGELNALERENILEARLWALSPRVLRRDDLLSERFLCELHRRMLGKVWRWAGSFRKSERNLGRPVASLAMDVRTLLDDALYWRSHGTYPVVEAAVRFHHRLVLIHPWVNGNGRHARLMADVLVCSQGGGTLAWGRSTGLDEADGMRARYLSALRAADAGDLGPLVEFAAGRASSP